jgi:streptogramin lyase
VRILVLSFAVAAACTHETRPEPEPRRPGPVIDAFSEPAAVAAIEPVGASVFVATSLGLDRWEATGKRRRFGAEEGIAGAQIRALALAPGGHLWFATELGIGRFDVDAGQAVMLPAPPAPIGEALATLRVLAVDRTGGVWVGAANGLYHADVGGWAPTSFKGEVTALYAAPNGALWLGTRDGVVERNVGGVFTAQREGSTLKNVVAIGEGPDGAPIAVGDDAEGHPRVAVFLDGQFTTYRLSNEARVTQTAHRTGGFILYTPGRLLTLFANDTAVVGLRRDGVHLLHVAGKRKKSPYTVGLLDGQVPADVTALATSGNAIYLGTRALGTERIVLDREQGTATWLRPRELVVGARSLFVACADRNECYVATGGVTGWKYDGKLFAPLFIGRRPFIILAVVRDPHGAVLALYREPGERMLHVAKLTKGSFTPVTEVKVETPSGATVLAFAKFAPDGLLWLGLQYLDDDGDPRPYGVAIVDLSLNSVSYHHEGKDSRKTGVLPVPNDVVDVAFMGEEVWFASGSGAAQLKAEHVRVWTEADELRSEILHGVVATEGGTVYVASSSGIGQFDGQHWSYPPPLAMISNGLARGLDGRLWVGTDRGLVVFDGKKTERLDRRAGLADDRVLDVAVDYLGRVWARSPEGLSLVTPPQ